MDKRQENEDETRARDWLKQQGVVRVRRPSSDPPDFVIDGDCAVEVTRLNQRIVVGAKSVPRAKNKREYR